MNVPGRHLGRRFVTSLSPAAPAADDEAWAESWLDAGERALWGACPTPTGATRSRSPAGSSHRRPEATRAEIAGALLHDVGKLESGLGTFGRVVATVVGPARPPLPAYHDHEAIGARLAAAAGADPVTVALIEGHGPAAAALRDADDV